MAKGRAAEPTQKRDTAELDRLRGSDAEAWRRWGPYLSERQWGTVREDYSANGTVWDYFPHDHARSRAYRWGEDGLAGFSDAQQYLCIGLALWNGHDPILKERLFGLTNREGNHGEDVKEQYYYLDATPTHSYLRMLYKYPHRAFPYADLVGENHRRGRSGPEYELVDTGIFSEDRYFDVFVEYAMAAPDELLMRVSVHNRGPDDAHVEVLPQLWFRNTWSWNGEADPPRLQASGSQAVELNHPVLGQYHANFDQADELLFCENDTNPRLFGLNGDGHWKDAFHEYVVKGRAGAVNPRREGTKVAGRFRVHVPAGESREVRVRLIAGDEPAGFADFDRILAVRKREADAFYEGIQAGIADEDARRVQRQALAGMIWSKQTFRYDVTEWLNGDSKQPAPPLQRREGRNADWRHLNNAEVISMPDKWEYPWYAAWDLAFHCIPLAMVDAAFAKQQLDLLTREWYMHPNGQLPAYEWAFDDVNPPVHAWATWRVFQIDRKQRRTSGEPAYAGDLAFLERVFHKLLLNFTWWVNRKDVTGRNVFQGGFLGLDNIGVFDRSRPLPTGGYLNQSDGTAWMAMYSLNLLRMSLELARHNRVYEDIATKFFEHFLYIADAMLGICNGGRGLWDSEDEFYYDELDLPDGQRFPVKIRSMVGLIPLFAVETIEPEMLEQLPEFARRLEWVLEHRPELASLVSRWQEPGRGERRLLSLLRGSRMKRLLRRMLDESEFLSDYGVRALSKHHLEHPYTFWSNGNPLEVRYQPGESDSGLFGGNSNWRGPIWFPVNYLIIESLQKFHHYYGNDFKVECPTGSGKFGTLLDVADELSRRLTRIFLRDEHGRRAVFGEQGKLQDDPHFRDHVLFYEYFHGDNGRGVGASHQTGWTGLVAKLLQPRAADV